MFSHNVSEDETMASGRNLAGRPVNRVDIYLVCVSLTSSQPR